MLILADVLQVVSKHCKPVRKIRVLLCLTSTPANQIMLRDSRVKNLSMPLHAPFSISLMYPIVTRRPGSFVLQIH